MNRRLLSIIAILTMSEGLMTILGGIAVRDRPISSVSGTDKDALWLRQTLSRSPLRSDLWLALSAMEPEMTRDRVFEMAYLTGGEKAEEVPERLKQAMRFNLSSPALRELLRADLILIERRTPWMRAAVIAEYRNETPERRANFAAFLRAGQPDDQFWLLEGAP